MNTLMILLISLSFVGLQAVASISTFLDTYSRNFPGLQQSNRNGDHVAILQRYKRLASDNQVVANQAAKVLAVQQVEPEATNNTQARTTEVPTLYLIKKYFFNDCNTKTKSLDTLVKYKNVVVNQTLIESAISEVKKYATNHTETDNSAQAEPSSRIKSHSSAERETNATVPDAIAKNNKNFEVNETSKGFAVQHVEHEGRHDTQTGINVKVPNKLRFKRIIFSDHNTKAKAFDAIGIDNSKYGAFQTPRDRNVHEVERETTETNQIEISSQAQELLLSKINSFDDRSTKSKALDSTAIDNSKYEANQLLKGPVVQLVKHEVTQDTQTEISVEAPVLLRSKRLSSDYRSTKTNALDTIAIDNSKYEANQIPKGPVVQLVKREVTQNIQTEISAESKRLSFDDRSTKANALDTIAIDNSKYEANQAPKESVVQIVKREIIQDTQTEIAAKASVLLRFARFL